MDNRSTIGKIGEDHAATYLEKNGYKILDRNWRSNHLEIDIIANHERQLIIVEVKTRKNDYFGLPFEGINYQKQQNLGRAANAYMTKTHYFGEVRFDIVSIVLDKMLQPFEIEIIQDAFWFR